MGEITDRFLSAWRYWNTDGVPASGAHKPSKSEIQTIGAVLEAAIGSAAGGLIRFETKALMDADETRDDGTLAYVWNDTTPANNTIYQWDGSSWVLATWFYDGLAEVVQPLVDDAEAAAVSAGESASDAAAILSQIGVASDAAFAGTEEVANPTIAALTDNGGRFVKARRAADIPLPDWFGAVDLLHERHIDKTPLDALDTGIWFASDAPIGVASTYPHGRIPVLYRIPDTSRVLLFVQTRAGLTTDFEAGGLAMRVSDDGGETFGAERMLLVSDSSWHFDNVSPVYDPLTGRLWLIYSCTPDGVDESTVTDPDTNPANAVAVFSIWSDDPTTSLTFASDGGALSDGAAPGDGRLEAEARDSTSPWWIISPGNGGIVTPDNELLVCANGGGLTGTAGALDYSGAAAMTQRGFGVLIAYDRGEDKWVWRMKTPLGYAVNEAGIVVLKDGRILMDARAQNATASANRYRVVSISNKARTDWERTYFDTARPDCRCQGSLCRVAGGPGKAGLSILAFANNAVPTNLSSQGRYRLTVYLSLDEGRTFPLSIQLYDEPATLAFDSLGDPITPDSVATRFTGYSSVTAIDSETIALAYETLAIWPDGSTTTAFKTIHRKLLNIRDFLHA